MEAAGGGAAAGPSTSAAAAGAGGGGAPSAAAGPSSAAAAAPAAAVDRNLHPSGIVPQLQNVVATVNFGVPLDLKQIALHARNAEYNPKRFAAVIMRIREPKTTALIFGSGKMVCTGAKSEADARLAARKYCRIVQKLGFSGAEFKEFKIQNIVGSCDVRFPIRLEGLAYAHGYFATYEPELFPGLIYRMKQPKIVLLVFVSGKVVLTGAKRREEIYQAFENIYPTLTEFRKQDAGAGMAALHQQQQLAAQAAATQAAAAAAQQQQEGGGEAAAAGGGGAAGGAAPAAGAGSMRPPPRRPPAAAAAMPPPAATPAFGLQGAPTALPPPAATPAYGHHHAPGAGGHPHHPGEAGGAPPGRPLAPAPLAPPPATPRNQQRG